MKLVIHQIDGPPIEIEAERVDVMCGRDHFEMRELTGLFIRLEKHDGYLGTDLAVHPATANSVWLKGSP